MKLLIFILIFLNISLHSQWSNGGIVKELQVKVGGIEHVRPSINGNDLIVQYENEIKFYDLESGTMTKTYSLEHIKNRYRNFNRKMVNFSEDYISSIEYSSFDEKYNIDSIYSLSYGLVDTSKFEKTLINVQKPEFRITEFSKFVNIYEKDSSFYSSNNYSFVNKVNESTFHGNRNFISTTNFELPDKYLNQLKYIDLNFKYSENNGDMLYIDSNKLVRKGKYEETFNLENLSTYQIGHDNSTILVKEKQKKNDNYIYDIYIIYHESKDTLRSVYYNIHVYSKFDNLQKLGNEYYYAYLKGLTSSIVIFDLKMNPIRSFSIQPGESQNSSYIFNDDKYFYLWGFKIFKMLIYNFDSQLYANFTNPINAAKDSATTFYNLSVGKIDSVRWEFSNGLISNELNPSVVFQDTGYYDVKLIIFKNEQSEIINRDKAIYIYNEISPSFEITNISEDYPFKINIENTSIGNINKYEWYLNDYLISKNKSPEIEAKYLGNVNLKLKVINKYAEKEYSQDILLINSKLKDNFILNSELNLTNFSSSLACEYNFRYSNDLNKYFINYNTIDKSNKIPYDSKTDNQEYIYFSILDNKQLELSRTKINDSLIDLYQPQKVADDYNTSILSRNFTLTIPNKNDIIEYQILHYYSYNRDKYPIENNYYYGFIKMRDMNYQEFYESKDIINTQNSLNQNYIYLDKYILIYERNLLFINTDNYDFINHNFYIDKFNNKHKSIYNDVLQLISLENEVLTIEYFNIKDTSYSSKFITYKANKTFENSISKDSESLFILAKSTNGYNLLKFDNIKSEFVNSIPLEIDNPKTMSIHKDNIVIYGSNDGELAYETIINNTGQLTQYNGISGTFTKAESNQGNQFLAQASLSGITNKAFLLLMDYQEHSNISKNEVYNLIINGKEIVVPFNNYNIEIYDLLGKMIYNENNLTKNFSLSNLNNGIYLYIIRHNQKSYSGKFLIE